MARHLKIFQVEKAPPLIYVTPQGKGASFRYADLQMESNAVRTMVADNACKNLIIDLSLLNYFGSEFIGALIVIGRERKNRGGKVAICSASENMFDVLKNMSIFKLFPYYDTKADAIAAFDADE